MPAKKRATSAAPVAKRSRVDPQIAQRNSVAKALKSATEKHVAEMFVEMLPFVFVQPRHQYQDGVLDMISGILSEHEAGLRTKVSEHEVFVAGGDAERAKREQAISDAEAAVASKVEELQSAGSVVETCKSQLDSAKENLSEAEHERNLTVSRNTEAGDKNATLELALEIKQKLDEGVEDDNDRQNQSNHLHKLLSPVLEDKNMLNAMHLSLAKPKDKLEAFDNMVVQCVDAEMKKTQETVKTILAEADTSQSAADAKVASCQTTVDECNQGLMDAKLRMSAAKAAKQECDAALRAAKSKLSALKGELKESKGNLESSTQTLSEFVDGALSIFSELRHGPKEEKPEEKQEEKPEEKQEETPEEKQEEKQEDLDMAEEPIVKETQQGAVAVAAEVDAPTESPQKDLEKPREEVEPTNA